MGIAPKGLIKVKNDVKLRIPYVNISFIFKKLISAAKLFIKPDNQKNESVGKIKLFNFGKKNSF
jgi:hypothetical protein